MTNERMRELLADAVAVGFPKKPTDLTNAHEVLERDSSDVHRKSNSVTRIRTRSHSDLKVTSKMFATHPPIAKCSAFKKAMDSLI